MTSPTAARLKLRELIAAPDIVVLPGPFDASSAILLANMGFQGFWGGGYVGSELGQFFHRAGVQTAMIVRSGHLLSGEDHDIGHGLTAYLREEGMRIETCAQVHRVSVGADGRKVVHYRQDDQERDGEAAVVKSIELPGARHEPEHDGENASPTSSGSSSTAPASSITTSPGSPSTTPCARRTPTSTPSAT